MSNVTETADRYMRLITANVDNNAPFGWENRETGQIADSFDDLAEALDVPARVLDEMLTLAARIESGDIDPDDAHLIETPPTREEILGDWEPASAMTYLSDVLSTRYTVSGRGADDYISVEVAIAIGGPNVWINTAEKQLEVYWGGAPEVRSLPYSFCEAIDEAAAELWEMGA